MAMAIANTLLQTLDLRAGSVITESEIAALKKRWRPLGRLARTDPARHATEQDEVRGRLPMQISDEQGKRGLDYLRNTKLIREQGLGDDTHAEVIRRLDHFLFVGFWEDTNSFGRTVALYPIYRAVASNGPWFEYIARPWVGGDPTFGKLFEQVGEVRS